MSKLLNVLMLTVVSAIVSAAAFAGAVPSVTLDDTFDQAAAAVPEPAAVIAMGVGLATVAFVVRRRIRR